MKKVKITAIRRADYKDLQEIYENPIEHACEVTVGDSWISVDGKCPDGMCHNAWRCMESYAVTLAEGGGNFFDGWMKNPKSAMISCDDGFRPVSYLLETVEE